MLTKDGEVDASRLFFTVCLIGDHFVYHELERTSDCALCSSGWKLLSISQSKCSTNHDKHRIEKKRKRFIITVVIILISFITWFRRSNTQGGSRPIHR